MPCFAGLTDDDPMPRRPPRRSLRVDSESFPPLSQSATSASFIAEIPNSSICDASVGSSSKAPTLHASIQSSQHLSAPINGPTALAPQVVLTNPVSMAFEGSDIETLSLRRRSSSSMLRHEPYSLPSNRVHSVPLSEIYYFAARTPTAPLVSAALHQNQLDVDFGQNTRYNTVNDGFAAANSLFSTPGLSAHPAYAVTRRDNATLPIPGPLGPLHLAYRMATDPQSCSLQGRYLHQTDINPGSHVQQQQLIASSSACCRSKQTLTSALLQARVFTRPSDANAAYPSSLPALSLSESEQPTSASYPQYPSPDQFRTGTSNFYQHFAYPSGLNAPPSQERTLPLTSMDAVDSQKPADNPALDDSLSAMQQSSSFFMSGSIGYYPSYAGHQVMLPTTDYSPLLPASASYTAYQPHGPAGNPHELGYVPLPSNSYPQPPPSYDQGAKLYKQKKNPFAPDSKTHDKEHLSAVTGLDWRSDSHNPKPVRYLNPPESAQFEA